MGSLQEHCNSQLDPHHVAALYMDGIAPSTTFGSGHGRRTEQFVQRVYEEVFPPHHAFIDAQAFSLVVTPVFEYSFPARCVDRKELRGEERVQNHPSVLLISNRPLLVSRQCAKLQ